MKAYKVFLGRKEIDKIFRQDDDTDSREDIKKSLVEHDGYDPNIRVVKERGNRTPDKDTTDVIFRKYRKDGDIIALFPAIPATMGDCLSYQHIGQHGACDSNHVFFVTHEATPEEYADLYKELTEQVGYTLRVVKRTTAKHRRQRNEAVKAAVK